MNRAFAILISIIALFWGMVEYSSLFRHHSNPVKEYLHYPDSLVRRDQIQLHEDILCLWDESAELSGDAGKISRFFTLKYYRFTNENYFFPVFLIVIPAVMLAMSLTSEEVDSAGIFSLIIILGILLYGLPLFEPYLLKVPLLGSLVIFVINLIHVLIYFPMLIIVFTFHYTVLMMYIPFQFFLPKGLSLLIAVGLEVLSMITFGLNNPE